MKRSEPKILVIRRDNIGDLVCTTPIFSALRAHFPQAEICALVNSYNAAVLENNPDIDSVFTYTKAKHRPPGKSVAGIYWDRVKLILALRRKHFDYAILAGMPPSVPQALKLARLVHPRHIIGYGRAGHRSCKGIDLAIPYEGRESSHETEDVFQLLAPLGIKGPLPSLKIYPNPDKATHSREKIAPPPGKLVIGIHISARKPSQRWPIERFIGLITQLAKTQRLSFALFWSPGEENNPMHPGDDRKAQEILSAVEKFPVVAYPTHQLQDLIAGLSICDALICSDGGAMHLAAGLGKPILCFFGKSNAVHWRPWGCPHVLIQPLSQEVADISVDQALSGFMELLNTAGISLTAD